MKKWFKILGYALTLSIPLSSLITMAFSKVFLGKFIIINNSNILLFLCSTILITIFIGYWLSDSDRKF